MFLTFLGGRPLGLFGNTHIATDVYLAKVYIHQMYIHYLQDV